MHVYSSGSRSQHTSWGMYYMHACSMNMRFSEHRVSANFVGVSANVLLRLLGSQVLSTRLVILTAVHVVPGNMRDQVVC